jgi:uncharacterized protein (TIGR02646 family)
MIKINRPVVVPLKLSGDGYNANEANKLLYDADKKKYDAEGFSILNAIYGDPSVKSSLKAAQHQKCCYCERDQSEEHGAVEHYRPKKGYKQSRGRKEIKPGYYWLGYEWSNLLFTCAYCNSAKHKGSLFPLKDESKRAKSHHDNISLEDPMLIDPANTDPIDHIFFEKEIIKGKTDYGWETINICGLDRETLNTKRKALIDHINARLVILTEKGRFSVQEVQDATDYIKNAQLPNAEFSAAARDYLDKKV